MRWTQVVLSWDQKCVLDFRFWNSRIFITRHPGKGIDPHPRGNLAPCLHAPVPWRTSRCGALLTSGFQEKPQRARLSRDADLSVTPGACALPAVQGRGGQGSGPVQRAWAQGLTLRCQVDVLGKTDLPPQRPHVLSGGTGERHHRPAGSVEGDTPHGGWEGALALWLCPRTCPGPAEWACGGGDGQRGSRKDGVVDPQVPHGPGSV